jgi:lipid-binding SYLF domain-containing protein
MLRFLALVVFAATLAQADPSDTVKRLAAATEVFQEVMQVPERSIPQELLEKAACVVIVPGMKKGAFIVGGKYGRGFVSCRREGGVGWSAPGAIRIEGGTFGLQIGGAETDVIMLVLNRRGMDKLLSSKFTLGGDATATAGPVGRSSTAATDATMHAEILTWSRARGLFAGIALQGATLRPDGRANHELYGRELTNRAVVMSTTQIPRAAEPLVAILNKYSSRN